MFPAWERQVQLGCSQVEGGLGQEMGGVLEAWVPESGVQGPEISNINSSHSTKLLVVGKF